MTQEKKNTTKETSANNISASQAEEKDEKKENTSTDEMKKQEKIDDDKAKNDMEAKQEKEVDNSTVANKGKSKKRGKRKRQVLKGEAHIQCTYNNTIITLTDINGNVLAWSSAGMLGFKGAKKSTPYAATQVANDVTEKVKKYGLQEVNVYIKGVGGGREASIRGLANRSLNILSIKDITPHPHNGCRPRKPRRV